MNGFKTSQNTKQRRSISLATALCFMFLIFSKSSVACTIAFDPDTNTVKYALNDPRNPDCPCHAAQKLADEEYKKLQEQNQQVVNTNDANANQNANADHSDVNTNANKVVTTSSGSGSSKHYSSSKHFLKQLKKFNRKMKKQLRNKGNGTKKGNRRLASCFHF